MISTSGPALLAYAIAFGGAIIVALLALWGFSLLKRHAEDTSYESQLADLIRGDEEDEDISKLERGRNIKEKWVLYWQRAGVGSGIARYSDKNNEAPRDVLILGGGIFLLVSVLMRNPVFGLVLAIASIYVASLLAKMRYNRQVSKIQDQLPGFLFALKANIQANETPVRALLKVVDNMPQPLRGDLDIVKQKLLANSSFADALQLLVERTSSNELRFLATCLIQASGTGANIEPQLNTIQRVLEQRKKAADELSKAVKGTIPAIFVSSVAIPGSFIATYIIDPTSKDFWFKEILSWIALGAIAFLYGLGMWLTHKMVENIRNL